MFAKWSPRRTMLTIGCAAAFVVVILAVPGCGGGDSNPTPAAWAQAWQLGAEQWAPGLPGRLTLRQSTCWLRLGAAVPRGADPAPADRIAVAIVVDGVKVDWWPTNGEQRTLPSEGKTLSVAPLAGGKVMTYTLVPE